MPRKRKADNDAETLEKEPLRKKIKTVAEWVEPVEVEEGEKESDHIESLFDEIDSENRYMLTVERLPDFLKDGKIAARATRIYCGRIPLTRDYLDQIQQIWGAGNYRLTARFVENGQIRKVWFESVDRPPLNPSNPAIPQPYPVPIYPQEERKSDLEQLSQVAQQLAIIRDSMGWTTPQQAPPPSDSDDKKLDLILSILAKNESLGERLLDRLIGEEKEESIWRGFLRAVPDLIKLISQAAQSQNVQNNPQLISENNEPDADQDEPHMKLIAQLLNEMAQSAAKSIIDQASIERGAGWIRQFQQEHPEYADLLLNLINGSPEQVMAALVIIFPEAEPLRKNRFCLEWIKSLQDRLRRP